jgi:hypothetical protein
MERCLSFFKRIVYMFMEEDTVEPFPQDETIIEIALIRHDEPNKKIEVINVRKLKADYRNNYINKCRFVTSNMSKIFPPTAWMVNLEPFGWIRSYDQLHKMDWIIYQERDGKLVASNETSTVPFEKFKHAYPWFVHGNNNKLSPVWTEVSKRRLVSF